MDLSYGKEYDAFRAEVREFLAASWPPRGDDAGLSRKQAAASFRDKATARGYLHRGIPVKYGGSEQEPDEIKANVIREEFSRVRAPMDVRGIGTMMLVPTLLERGEGWSVSRSTLKHERNSIGASAQTAMIFAGLVHLARTTRRSGKPNNEDPSIRQRLARIEGYVKAQEYSGYRQLSKTAKGEDPGIIQMMNKIVSTNIGNEIAQLALAWRSPPRRWGTAAHRVRFWGTPWRLSRFSSAAATRNERSGCRASRPATLWEPWPWPRTMESGSPKSGCSPAGRSSWEQRSPFPIPTSPT